MDLSALNKLASQPFLPTVKIADLMIGKAYCVVGFREPLTKYGLQVVADVSPAPGNHDEDISVFLPKKMANYLLTNYEQYNALKAEVAKDTIVMDCVAGSPQKIAFRKL